MSGIHHEDEGFRPIFGGVRPEHAPILRFVSAFLTWINGRDLPLQTLELMFTEESIDYWLENRDEMRQELSETYGLLAAPEFLSEHWCFMVLVVMQPDSL